MKKEIKKYWWIFINAKRFRVKYYECGRYSVLMRYSEAKDYRDIFGGQLIIDYNKNLNNHA